MAKAPLRHIALGGKNCLSWLEIVKITGSNCTSISFSLVFLVLFINACADYSPSLGDNWIFDTGINRHPFVWKNGSMEGHPFIPCNVISYANDDHFIIAAQKPDLECIWKGEDAKRADAANKTGNSVNFWIIDIGADKVIGPLSINEYYQQRQQLNIPDDLKMNVNL